MTRMSHNQVYGLLGLAALAVSGGGSMLLVTGPRAGAAHDVGDRDAPLPRVVCFGHVDVEDGVTSLYPLVAGRVRSVTVRENTEVQAGAEIIRLDDTLALLRVKEADADLAAARDQLAQSRNLHEQHRLRLAQQQAAIVAVQQRLVGAREIRERKRDLEKSQHVSAREVRAAEALVKEVEALLEAETDKLQELSLNDPKLAIRRAQAEVDAKESRWEQARRGVSECVLVAPTDGIVLRVLVRPGEVLGPQPKGPAVLFCHRGPRIVRAEVEQEYAGRVEIGQTAAVQDDTTASTTWRGKVMRLSDWYTQRRSILQEPYQLNDVRTLECIVALDPGQPPLRIGQRVRVIVGQIP